MTYQQGRNNPGIGRPGGGQRPGFTEETFNLNAGSDNFKQKQVDLKTLRSWFSIGITPQTVEFADEFGNFLANGVGKFQSGMTTSQIRNIFGELRRIQMNGYKDKEKTSFMLLKPKLAYVVKRNNAKNTHPLYKFFELFSVGFDVITKAENEQDGERKFENLMQLMEAVLAYHKFHGGKE